MDPDTGFRTPKEVTDYFAQKRLRPAFSWLDVWGEEHAFAHTVAKAVDAELLGTFQSSLKTALADGQSFETWKAGIRSDLTRLGWWQVRKVSDPLGIDKDKLIDFTSTRRLKTIFWSNMRSARAAGQWERIQRTKRALPYILYVRTAAADPRPEHLAWAGIVLPVDDPFWTTHFPPNGWGCKCAVRQITAREARRLLGAGQIAVDGVKVPITNKAPPIETSPHTNRRTGAVTEIPEGIDAGWHTNPGLARARTLARRLNEDLSTAGPAVARDRIAELFNSRTPEVLAGLPERVQLPVAVSEKLADELKAVSPLVVASNETIKAKVGKHAVVSLDTFSIAQSLIDQGRIVDEGRSESQRAIYVQIGGGWWKLVIKRSAQGYLRLHTIYRVDASRARKWINRGGK